MELTGPHPCSSFKELRGWCLARCFSMSPPLRPSRDGVGLAGQIRCPDAETWHWLCATTALWGRPPCSGCPQRGWPEGRRHRPVLSASCVRSTVLPNLGSHGAERRMHQAEGCGAGFRSPTAPSDLECWFCCGSRVMGATGGSFNGLVRGGFREAEGSGRLPGWPSTLGPAGSLP